MATAAARSPASAPLLVLGSIVSVQFGQALGKRLAESVGPGGAVTLRLGLAALLLVLVFRPAPPRSWAELRLTVAFGTAIAGMNLIYPALNHLPMGLAISLQLLGPVCLAALTSRTLLDLLAAVAAGAGVWLFHVSGGAHHSVRGVLFALAAGGAMAAYLLLSRRAGQKAAGGAPLASALVWATVLTLPFGVAERPMALLEPRVLLSGLTVAVVSAVLPYSLELAALRRLHPRTVGVLQSLEPAAAGAAGVLVLGEGLGVVQWLALGCVGAASAAAVLLSGPGRTGRTNRAGRTGRAQATFTRWPGGAASSHARNPVSASSLMASSTRVPCSEQARITASERSASSSSPSGRRRWMTSIRLRSRKRRGRGA